MKARTKSLLAKAIRIAVEAHSGHVERNGDPYITHAFRVMGRVRTADEKIVAVLHDVIEDNKKWTFAMLTRRGFSKHLLDALDCVTIRSKERYPAAIRRAASNPIARRVKLADLEDNMDVRRLPYVRRSDPKGLNKYLRAYRRLSDPSFPGPGRRRGDRKRRSELSCGGKIEA